MRADVSAPVATMGVPRRMPSRSDAVPVLQMFALALMIIPSDAVIQAIGGAGYVAGLIGMFAFATFIAATLLGLHNPLQHRHPVRSVICVLWLTVLASYVLMDRPQRTVVEIMAADRQLLVFAILTGVALVAAECLTSLSEIRRVLRALTWGGAFCGAAAALQFWISVDITQFPRDLPGFAVNSLDTTTLVARGGMNRVAGTALCAIELGVVAAMLLPLAITLAIYDTERTWRRRWVPVMLIGISIVTSVSRSAILAAALAMAVFVVLMPNPQRLFALCAVPFALGAIFMSAHGLIGTLTSFFAAGRSDMSVQARTNDFPLVEQLVHQRPWLGRGPGTWIPENPLDIFDNQYLKTVVELGLVGVAALLALFLVPIIGALVARQRSSNPELRLLCASLAGATLAAMAASATFDSLSFPMFAGVFALVIGLIGATFRLAEGERSATGTLPAGRPHAYPVGRNPASTIHRIRSAGG
jgi:O-Antigen ligase